MLGDEVADASSIPRPWAAFFNGQVTVSEEQVPPSPPGACQKPTGGPIRNSAKTQHTRIPTYPTKTTQFPPHTQWPMLLRVIQKKNNVAKNTRYGVKLF